MMSKHSKHPPKASADVPLKCPLCATVPERPVAAIFPRTGTRRLDVPYLRCSTCRIFEIDRRGAIRAALALYRNDPDPQAAKAFAERVNAILKGLAENLSARGYRKGSFVPHTKPKPRP